MSDKDKEATGAQTVASKATGTTANGAASEQKVSRRGVAAARGTQRLKFTHELAKTNGLFLGQLISVERTNILIGENTTGMPSFNGLEIPKIVFTFCSNEDEVAKRHFTTLQFTAVESNVNTIPGGKEEWKVNAIFDWFKHVLNVFILKGRELTDEEANSLGLSFEDFDEQGEYTPVESEVVIEAWRQLFENVQNMLERGNEDKPVYKQKDGKPIALWLKLIRYIKNNKKGWQAVNNGDLSFPTFVGEGAIEIFKTNTNPSIRIDAVKESIKPMDIDNKAKSPNMAGMPNMPGVPSGGMGNFGGPYDSSANSLGDDDIPF